jgi:dTMP kinase
LTTYVFGSIAQGAPFVLVAAALERRGVGPAWLAAVAAVRLAPYLLCSPLAGAIAGRHTARTVFAVSGLSRGALLVAVWVTMRVNANPAVLVALLFGLVAVGTPTFPALMRSVRRAVPTTRLDRTSALAAGLESAAFGAGPAVGGVLLLADASNALLVCAAIMALSAALAFSLSIPDVAAKPIGRRSSRPVRSAGRYLIGPGLRTTIVAVVAVNVLAGLHAALLVRLPTGLGLGGERTFGLLSFVHGVGAFGTFVVFVGLPSRNRHPLLPLAAAGSAVGALSATSELFLAVIACCVLGASILAAEVLVISTVGRLLPGSLVAPGFGVLDALMTASMVSGALVAPVLTSCFGLRPTLAIAAVAIPLLASCAQQSRPERRGR